MKINDLPTFSSTLEFLTILALSTGRLLKVCLSPSPLLNSKHYFFPVWWHPRHPFCGASCPHRLKSPKILFFSEPPAVHAGAYTFDNNLPGSGGQVASGTETTGQAQIVNALGVPFALEGLFGEVDAEAMDAKPDLELAADAMGMDVEDDAKGAAAIADSGMIVDDDDAAANNVGTLCVF
jgi:nuclear GTP-binding protein